MESPASGSAATDQPTPVVLSGYDRLAATWDQWSAAVTPDLRASHLSALEEVLAPGSDVLELGSGTGHPIAARLVPAHRYIGIDISPAMVEAASRNIPDAVFRVGNMTDITFPAGSFDAVVAYYSIIHVPRETHQPLLERIWSWLRPGGHFAGCLTANDLPGSWNTDWLDAGPMYWSGFDTDTNLQLLDTAGFDVESAHVHTQMEGDTEVRFLWVVARRPIQKVGGRG